MFCFFCVLCCNNSWFWLRFDCILQVSGVLEYTHLLSQSQTSWLICTLQLMCRPLQHYLPRWVSWLSLSYIDSIVFLLQTSVSHSQPSGENFTCCTLCPISSNECYIPFLFCFGKTVSLRICRLASFNVIFNLFYVGVKCDFPVWHFNYFTWFGMYYPFVMNYCFTECFVFLHLQLLTERWLLL